MQTAGYVVLLLGSIGTAALVLGATGSVAGSPETAFLSILFTPILGGAALIVFVGTLLFAGPALLLMAPFGMATRSRYLRWIGAAAEPGQASRTSWAGVMLIALIDLFIALLGALSLAVAVAGAGFVSVGSMTAIPLWALLLLALALRSHLPEALVLSGQGTGPTLRRLVDLLRAHPLDIAQASLFQVAALVCQIGVAGALSFLPAMVLFEGTFIASIPAAALGAGGLSIVVYGWVMIRSSVALGLLRAVFVRDLLR